MEYGGRFRHELKYIINEMDMDILRNRLKHVMNKDINSNHDGRYLVESIYFDDLRDSAFYEKIDGVNERNKYRIRFYNDNNSYIVLERKSKHNGLTQKTSCEISMKQFDDIMKGRISLVMSSQARILKEFGIRATLNRLRPCQLVVYTREPYIYSAGNVRITFDMNLRTSIAVGQDFSGLKKGTFPVMQKGLHILEIKYDNYFPEHIRNIIQLNTRQPQACSKYVLCRLAAANHH